MEKITIDDLIRATGKYPREWEGNCHWAATELAKLIQGSRVVRGFWWGPLKGYWSSHDHRAFTGHSWVELKDGTVVDPTRWSFEDATPYIFEGEERNHYECSDFCPNNLDDEDDEECACGHHRSKHKGNLFKSCTICGPWPYDEGGNRIREEMKKPAPDPVPGAKVYELPSGAASGHVKKLMGDALGLHGLDDGQVFWLANMPYNALQPHAKDIYHWISATGNGAFIPIDNHNRSKQ